MTDWHGWTAGGVGYHVTKHPRRKQIVLMRVDGSVASAAGYFRSEEKARAFLAWLDAVVEEATHS